jgi:hypothetical protein
MKSKLILSLPLAGCLALASCYPIPDKKTGTNPPKKDQTVTSQEQQKIQEQRDRMKEAEEKKEEVTTTDVPKETPEGTTTTTPDKPTSTKPGDYAFANPVPGKEGFVFSPYNQKLVDVRDIPSGTLVQDPTYPAAEKKYFRVP